MDLRMFYQKLREVEGGIAEDPAIVISLETPDGGRAGVPCEVTRPTAAKLVVTGRARLASEKEAADYRKSVAAAFAEREQEINARRVQLTVISEAELRNLRDKSQRKG